MVWVCFISSLVHTTVGKTYLSHWTNELYSLIIRLLIFILGFILLINIDFESTFVSKSGQSISIQAGVVPFETAALQNLSKSEATFVAGRAMTALGRSYTTETDQPRLIPASSADCPNGKGRCQSLYLLQGFSSLAVPLTPSIVGQELITLYGTPFYHLHLIPQKWDFDDDDCIFFIFEGIFFDQFLKLCARYMESEQGKSLLIGTTISL